jgi:TNF receptor-associated factor 4
MTSLFLIPVEMVGHAMSADVFNSSCYSDNVGKRDIKALRIKCNIHQECEWEGTVGTWDKHVTTCKFALVPCPKDCKTEVDNFMRKDLDNHLQEHCPNRDYTCHYCGKEGTYASITQVHDLTCEKKTLPCPNAGCGDTMERQQVPEHVSECPHTVVSCKYKGIGCDTELERKDMAAHEQDDKIHLHMALVTLNSQENRIKTLEEESQTVTRRTFKFTGSEARKTFPPFDTSPRGYRMQVVVHGLNSDGTHVSVLVAILKGSHDAELKWPFTGKVSITLLNQLEDSNHYSKVISNFTRNDRFNITFGKELSFIAQHKLAYNGRENTQYLKDDAMYFRVSVIEVGDYKPWLECEMGPTS